MTKPPARSFSREFKLQITARMQGGETIAALSEELKVHRQLLYKWRDWARGGAPPRARGRRPRAPVEALPASAAKRMPGYPQAIRGHNT